MILYLAVAVTAFATSSCGSGSPVAGHDTTAPSARWTLSVAGNGMNLGPLSVGVGIPHSSAVGWLEYSVTLRNRSRRPVYLDDNRNVYEVPAAHPVLVVADPGCGPGGHPPTATLLGCDKSYKPEVVAPQGAFTTYVRVWKGIAGLNTLRAGTLRLTRSIRYRLDRRFTTGDASSGVRIGRLSVAYRVAEQ
jgi:hypothetical protein